MPSPDGRTNPTPVHFARNIPVEIHPPVSSRLLHQRQLDREGRAICRIVYAHGIGVQFIASVFCVAEDTVIQAIQNNASNEKGDTEEHDYFYVSKAYRNQYPPMPKSGERQSSETTRAASDRSSSMSSKGNSIEDQVGFFLSGQNPLQSRYITLDGTSG
ncbi:hypothetical protein B0H15DRAFT_138897 [Mycena belliarum]|uniref:Uncharacterized protein n=1 Tax=Mycena belliarum TaxID=1033014 RepID=A0AAD6XI04_9AGAR|nr:hypothetical protein B0H15DRAFT_138897 [Mycena belliae]